jgi:hypothetical protein
VLKNAKQARVIEGGAETRLGLKNARERVFDRFVFADYAPRDEIAAFRGLIGSEAYKHSTLWVFNDQV